MIAEEPKDLKQDAALEAITSGKEDWKIFEDKHVSDDCILIKGNLGDLKQHELVFNRKIKFLNCDFKRWPFGQCIINASMKFIGCKFDGSEFQLSFVPDVDETKSSTIEFDRCTFNSVIECQRTSKILILQNCIIKKGVKFLYPVKGSVSIIGNCTSFHGPLVARGINFSEDLVVHGFRINSLKDNQIQVDNGIQFAGAVFQEKVAFTDLHVTNEVDFSGAKFQATTQFTGTVFEEAPKFHGALLNPETLFDPIDRFDKQFPDLTSKAAEKRYQTLKVLFSQQQALGEQLGFSRLEMKAHSYKIGWLSPHRAYGWFSDYGLSWCVPALWLFASMLFFAVIYSLIMAMRHTWSDALLYSIQNAFPFVNGVKQLALSDMIACRFHLVAALIVLLQTLSSSVLLFLVALGIRNRLRMK